MTEKQSMQRDSPRVFDGHNDCLYRLPSEDAGTTFFEKRPDWHLDYSRAQDGGFSGGLFAFFVEPSPETTPREERRRDTADGFELEPPQPPEIGYAQDVTEELFDRLDELLATACDRMTLVDSASELHQTFHSDSIACVAHFEGAAPIEPDCSNLNSYYDRGLRSLGLVWSRSNQFGHGVPFEFPGHPDTGPGLTEAGKRLVEACNERGIMIDLAHLNEAGFWDVAERSSDPLVVSHAGVHDICPSSRNLTDEQLEAVADTDGLVGITFAASALRPDGQFEPDTPLSILLDHIEYVAEAIGVAHVALGSDFDGAEIIDSVGDASGLPRIFDGLRDRGFSESERRAIAHENWLRVLEETWQ